MENTDTNTQTQPPAAPVASGSKEAELQAKVAELEKAREGLIRDVQHERARRQELETHIQNPPAPPAAQPGVTDDELGKVLKPYIAPVAKEAAEAKQELQALRLEKAQSYLEKATGKSWAQIEADHDFQSRMNQVIKKYGVTGNVYDMTVRAHELMKLEDLKAKEEDRARAASVAQVQSLPSGTGSVSTSSTKKYSADEFNRLNPLEFGNLADTGDFRKLPDGTFEYTPR